MKRIAYDYSCLMAALPEDLVEKIKSFAGSIPAEQIYETDDGEHGIPNSPHVTVKYGIHTKDADEVLEVLGKIAPLTAKLGDVSVFDNKDTVVLKVDVESDDLTKLNSRVSEALECTDTHPEYKPHITIAYLKKGTDYEGYLTDDFKGANVKMTKLVFSVPGGRKQTMVLGSRIAKEGDRKMKLVARLLKISRSLAASTRSWMGYRNRDGSIEAAYCHYDSYNNFAILRNSYSNMGSAVHLVDGGDMKQLKEDLNSIERYGEGPHSFRTYDEFMSHGEDYMFLFINGRWYDVTHGLPSAENKAPTRESHKIDAANTLRMALRVPTSARIMFEEFMTFTEGTSNKFHYFAIYEDRATGEYVGGNSYGRIGSRPSAIEVARGDRTTVEAAVYKKVRSKKGKGYTTADMV